MTIFACISKKGMRYHGYTLLSKRFAKDRLSDEWQLAAGRIVRIELNYKNTKPLI